MKNNKITKIKKVENIEKLNIRKKVYLLKNHMFSLQQDITFVTIFIPLVTLRFTYSTDYNFGGLLIFDIR
jgi:hypothetical protein